MLLQLVLAIHCEPRTPELAQATFFFFFVFVPYTLWHAALCNANGGAGNEAYAV